MVSALLTVALIAPTKVSGWVVFWNPASLASFEKNASQLDEVFPEWTYVTAEGEIARRTLGTTEQKSKLLATAKQHGVKVLGMASNFAETDFDPVRMTKFLNDPKKRARNVAELVSITQQDKLDGIDLDYESLKKEDREVFSLFVEELGRAMRAKKLILSVTVHPKFAEPGNWDGPMAQDWKRIGRAADRFRIMAYDQHYSNSDPGPIAADEWVEKVVKFAVTQVPAKKIDLGVACYGYNWATKPATSMVWDDVPPKTPFEICPRSGERMFGKARFGGPESFLRKKAIQEKYRLRGLSFWYIGSEVPEFWAKF